MAQYQDISFLFQSPHPVFDIKYPPGAIVSASGIYRCNGCGYEIVIVKGGALPSDSEHGHDFELGFGSWQLIVRPISTNSTN